MSESPFGRLPDNPYASPYGLSRTPNPLLIPAIFLLVLAALFLLVLLISLPGQVLRLSQLDPSTPAGAGELLGGILSLFVWISFMLTIIAGSICMLREKGYAVAWAAAICSVVPFCSPCFVLGIPFGIWAMILLTKPDVRQRFGTYHGPRM